ncbi:progranulin-like isoform X1 [Anneissia japonica]|uniref:progranulin-like isoform X1 n=1 Tax=Anneissia japonica TaxID=1529436 RepID=UPI0014254F55|nr:progranulin-like isoform X1 [Anneissia japonica]
MKLLFILGMLASVQADPILRFKPNFNLHKVTCEDQTVCDDDNTCCQLDTGEWGCCPYPKAVCCSDKLHCCPTGTTCDMAESKCLNGVISFPWMEKTRSSPPGTFMCPDRQSYCPSEQFTCCMSSTGGYDCCPQPKAVCCGDDEHCCPTGYSCDMKKSACLKGDIQMFWYEKLAAEKLPSLFQLKDINCPDGDFEKLENVICPDGQSYCPTGSTCCQQRSGVYGCCPLETAVCCNDGIHCCPQGYKCDIAGGTCENYTSSIALFSHIPAKLLKSVVCPGGQSQCPDGNTCCRLSSGQYGCCPLPKAVCCSDGLHCCPSGYTCDTGAGTCTKGALIFPWVEKTEAKTIQLESVMCPDGQSECPDGNTCCKLSSGQYGCCPMPNAVCCSDGLHCCPSGYTCDTSAGTCTKGALTLPWVEKTEAKIVKLESVMCPDGQSECPDGNTCCKLSSGQYGCCPMPNAVCCSDGLHCCPSGYTCDTSAGTCTKGALTLPWVEKTEATFVNNILSYESPLCPDGHSRCSDGYTCCKMSTGVWGCCPLPDAVCCEDGIHCCPKDNTCDDATPGCIHGNIRTPWFEKVPANQLKSVMCPDGQSECPDGNTCCKMSNGQYGCCPMPNAECCSDGLHCCPSGYTCDVVSGSCSRGAITVPWMAKQPATVQSVICPGGRAECDDGNTCCKLANGDYGCCPLKKAVCCSDKLHCCPEGQTCDTSEGKCLNGDISVPWYTKTGSRPIDNAIICPDGRSQCPNDNTCCQSNSGSWLCCPLPKAVCCSDGENCCPNGYRCNVSQGTCIKQSNVFTLVSLTRP